MTSDLDARILAASDGRPFVEMRVFHPPGQGSCDRVNWEGETHRWRICATLAEMLRSWPVSGATRLTTLKLVSLLLALPSDAHGRGFFPSDTTEPALVSPTLDLQALHHALTELKGLCLTLGCPGWSYVFDRALDDAAFIDTWLTILDAHRDCSDAVEFRGFW
jgi:hypothetical protein